VFEHLHTDDFEFVLKMLWHASKINQALQTHDDRTFQACESVRDALVPETGYVAYLTRIFGVREPESLSDAQLKKEIEFLLRRTQHPDQAERFRMQCARLAQPAA
jgi:hypothetical protein